MGTRSKVGAACCGLVIAVTACGGGSERLTAAEYAREASRVCQRTNRAIARVDAVALTGMPRAAQALERVVELQRDAVAELRDLRPPDGMRATVERWIALLDQAADELGLAGARARAGRALEAREFAGKARTLLDRARDVTAPIRVVSCRGPDLSTA